eukprot:5160001-Lingulodinium_polyedra.AAC.1
MEACSPAARPRAIVQLGHPVVTGQRVVVGHVIRQPARLGATVTASLKPPRKFSRGRGAMGTP